MQKETKLQRFERILGNIIATILVVVWITAILISIYNFVFWDESRTNFYGNRGQFYMAE